MELIQLEAFERTVREGNFTRAAEAMGLTQPAVSTRIAQLEAELGGPLFERHGRNLKLTPLGERFLPYAQRMLAVMADGLQMANDFRMGKVGAVRIAAPTPFILSFLMIALERFRQEYPTIDIWIRERDKATTFDLIRDNAIRLGLVNAPVLDVQMAKLLHLQDPIRCVVGATHPLAERADEILPIHVLYNYTIFRVSMFPQMTAFVDEIVEHGRHGSGGAVIAIPMVLALRLVLQGQGVTFLPESYVRSAVEEGQLVHLHLDDMPPLYSRPVLIAHRDRLLDPIHAAFVEVFKNCWQHLIVEIS
ncbi:MAG: hypothetical protein CUN55_11260 [Phototrophicales bacterium]|nr:MAG: hypothetical protein CUN55_11260 [Phototrophicales bacterium]